VALLQVEGGDKKNEKLKKVNKVNKIEYKRTGYLCAADGSEGEEAHHYEKEKTGGTAVHLHLRDQDQDALPVIKFHA
jgi:hypothetical protein